MANFRPISMPSLFRRIVGNNSIAQTTLFLHVLGIESSCDDAAVAVVDARTRRVLADRRSADHDCWRRLGGVLPYSSARHHRSALGPLVEAALADAGLRASDLDLIAVSCRPGIVLCLKVGIEHALSLARHHRRPLVPVHHMRAHALVARLRDPLLHFPFATLLVSGAHCLICAVYGPNKFFIMAESISASPGECLDKLARQLELSPLNGSFGAALEQQAKKCPPGMDTRFAMPWWHHGMGDELRMDFDHFRVHYLPLIHRHRPTWRRDERELGAWCAGIQHSLTEFICRRLDSALAFLASSSPTFPPNLVVAGGVASNAFFMSRVRAVAAAHDFRLVVLPPELCTDNGVMVAWAGAEMMMMEEEKKRRNNSEEDNEVEYHHPEERRRTKNLEEKEKEEYLHPPEKITKMYPEEKGSNKLEKEEEKFHHHLPEERSQYEQGQQHALEDKRKEGKDEENEPAICWPNALPDKIWAEKKAQIGPYLEEFWKEQQQKGGRKVEKMAEESSGREEEEEEDEGKILRI